MELEKFAFPVVVGAAILGIWAALRNNGAPAGNGVTSSYIPSQGAGIPPLPPMQQYLASMPTSIAPSDRAGRGMGTHRPWIRTARANPTVANPADSSAPNSSPSGVFPNWLLNGDILPPSLTANLPPSLDFAKFAQAPKPDAPAGGCGGCSGGCGGGGPKPCSQRSDTTNRRYSDGRGACLASNTDSVPTNPNMQLPSWIYGVVGHVGVSDDSLAQSA